MLLRGKFLRMKKKIGNIQKKINGKKRLWGKEILIGLVSKKYSIKKLIMKAGFKGGPQALTGKKMNVEVTCFLGETSD